MKKSKVKRVHELEVGTFIERHGMTLKMSSLNGDAGYNKKIIEPSVHRPGLALAGFLDCFAHFRVQVLGNSEFSYLQQLDEETRRERFRAVLNTKIPCIVIARDGRVPQDMIDLANEYGLSVFVTPLNTMDFTNNASLLLEQDFAPSTSQHGCMISYKGLGILIAGKSGSGKSEAAISLIEDGAALIADDKVAIKNVNQKLIAFNKEGVHGFLEMRGVGIINVGNLYGLGAIRKESEIDLIVFLKPTEELNQVDRLGIKRKKIKLLGLDVPYVEIPVAPGRDTARLINVTALELQLRKLGYDMASEFNDLILNKINQKKPKNSHSF